MAEISQGEFIFTCIICKKPKEDDLNSDEHIFPEAIGGTLITRNVCKPCNSELGDTVDITLIDHYFIKALRLVHQIPGKTGKIPNPLENAEMASDPEQKVKYIIEDGKPKTVYNVQRVTRKKLDDGNESIQITVDKSDEHKIPEILDKIIKRYKKQGIDAKFTDTEKLVEKVEMPTLHQQIDIDTYKYHQALFKIIYELGYHFLGDAYLSDSTGEKIRLAFLDKNFDVDFHQKHVLQGQTSINTNLLQLPFNDKMHYAMIVPAEGRMFVYVRIFNAFNCGLVISEASACYRPNLFQVIELNPTDRTYRSMTLTEFVSEKIRE